MGVLYGLCDGAAMGSVRLYAKSPGGSPVTTLAVCDFTGTVGPPYKACLAAITTVSSSLAGFNVTVPLMLWVAEVSKVGGMTTGSGAPLMLNEGLNGRGERE